MACVAVFEENVRRIIDYVLENIKREVGVPRPVFDEAERLLKERCVCTKSVEDTLSCFHFMSAMDLLNMGYPEEARVEAALVRSRSMRRVAEEIIREWEKAF